LIREKSNKEANKEASKEANKEVKVSCTTDALTSFYSNNDLR
jgi:hypothetical protein